MEKDLDFFRSHVEDMLKKSEQSGICLCSDFLTESERRLLPQTRITDSVQVLQWGGREDADRVVACFMPAGTEETLQDVSRISCLKITPVGSGFLSNAMTHRDYLGALVGCGIEREKLGDIICTPECAYAFVKEEMVDFLQNELTSVGSAVVSVAEVRWEETLVVPDKRELVISLNSLRLDSVISRAFNLSRDDGVTAVRQGKIFLNGLQATKNDKQVKAGDVISFRGKGKIKLIGVTGTSKSGRAQLKIEKYGRL